MNPSQNNNLAENIPVISCNEALNRIKEWPYYVNEHYYTNDNGKLTGMVKCVLYKELYMGFGYPGTMQGIKDVFMYKMDKKFLRPRKKL